ncbi:MAG: polyphenol oxidase family protein [Methylacidiphilales bacterium]|nr:polyphenol oxidase family protein [Candidatus Methylacidiphilales bacterium]
MVMELETFSALQLPGLRHAFSIRSSGPLEKLDAELRETFLTAGYPLVDAVEAEQIHGGKVQAVYTPCGIRVPEVDALTTSVQRMPLIVRVADCGPVYFYDPVQKVIGLAHSGRRGTEANIAARTIACLRDTYGSRPEDLIVQLGPCIRPPHYEVDFAAEIGRQVRTAGVRHYHDCGISTAAHLDRYYSYRAEKGKTGRMWAVLMLE